jgi:hypothetical protein
MPSFEIHCNESVKIFGKAFEEVHLWLDELAGKPPYGMRHRKVRHHQKGIEEAVRLFGSEAGEAARLHIIMDLKEEGWKENDPFPVDETHYKTLGLF